MSEIKQALIAKAEASGFLSVQDIEAVFAALTAGEQEPVARARVYMWKDRRQFSVNELGTKAAGELPVGVYDLYAAPPELGQLRNRVAELEKALEPVANLATAYDGIPPPKYFGDTDFELRYHDDHKTLVEIGLLRTARHVREGGKAE